MWRELIGFTGAAVAVINGLFAIANAMLPARRSVLKLRLAVLAIVLGVGALGVTIVARYAIHFQQERTLADRREARERIEGFIAEGRTLLAQIQSPQQMLPSRAADEWAQKAETYLRGRGGELYTARFRKDVSALYGDTAVPADRLPYWRAVRNRVVNLEAIAAELPSPLRQSTASTPRL